MKTKTNELTGAALDWAVAMTENWAGADFEIKPYSTDWSQGGPIIERENLELVPLCPGTWRAISMGRDWYNGRTPLEAAMRCYVASKLGDEVEVPEELI